MKPFILGAVFARGGSKGIPGKNIKPLNGKPLLAYAIEAGQAVPLIDKIIVSTDDDQIARVALEWGAEVPFMRPAVLATDDAPEILAWRHAVETYEQQCGQKVDILVSIPATSPLRISEDISSCLDKLLHSQADSVITVTEARRNPYFNMVTLDKDGGARIFSSPEEAIQCRQRAPAVFDVTTVAYAVRADFIRSGKPLFEGRVRAVIIPPERALDIDTPLDFELAEFFLKKRSGVL